MQIFEGMPGGKKPKVKKNTKLDFIDRAARGDIEAAAKLAEGYLKGKYECEKDKAKALKWASYAAKRGSALAQEVLDQI